MALHHVQQWNLNSKEIKGLQWLRIKNRQQKKTRS